ncbi:MAG: bifunctional GrpB family protein/GNAT family N-acetyltransferase [Legionellaceae bacterium]|nr:bifunctional GrpB family protein/GNAT family N-acetyltransferase [Legionellaceae bacterium]
MKMIEVEPYNPSWLNQFEQEAEHIQKALGENCIAVHHIGSTSVPGLFAKPIIDIMPVVKDIMLVDSRESEMLKLGYVAKGECGILFRRFFIKGKDRRAYNVHIFQLGSPVIDKHLLFRDWLREHPIDREAYGALKQEIIQKGVKDIEAYLEKKDTFVTKLIRKTGYKGLRIVHPMLYKEWESVRKMRQSYIFDAIKSHDPYEWTFDHPDHWHFILNQGVDIVGYAHIQRWPEDRVALRIIIIDEAYQHRGLGRAFLTMLEQWLKEKNVRSIHVESSPEAEQFYKHLGYNSMDFNDSDAYPSEPDDIPLGKLL